MKTATIMLDDDTVTGDGTVRVRYSGEALTPDELGEALAQLLSDTLGDDPQIPDVVAIQAKMAQALSR